MIGLRFMARRAGSGESEDADEPGSVVITDDTGRLVHVAPAAVAESVRYLIARVQLNDATGLPGRLALTSALSGEGVTYVARTFAAVVAHDLGRTVCLVDLDWWSAADEELAPGSGPASSRDPVRGIVDVVAGAADIDDVIEPTGTAGLAVVRSGRVEPGARSALVRSGDLDRVVDALADRFDHLVLELPPVLVTADALTLVRMCDTFLFVVHQGVTSARLARAALDQLDGAICLGTVLNRSSSRIPRRLAALMNG